MKKNAARWVSKRTGLPQGHILEHDPVFESYLNDKMDKKEDTKDIDWMKWLLAGGVGTLGYHLTSNMLDDGDEKHKKSTLMRLLRTLAPIAVGGLGAIGAYNLANRMGKKAQDNNNDDEYINVEDTRFDGPPVGRWATILGLGGGTLGSGYNFVRTLGEEMKVPLLINPSAEIISARRGNIQDINKRISQLEKRLVRSSPRSQSYKNTKSEIKNLSDRALAEMASVHKQIPNPEARGFRRWLRPIGWATAGVGSALGAAAVYDSLDYYKEMQKEIQNTRDFEALVAQEIKENQALQERIKELTSGNNRGKN